MVNIIESDMNVKITIDSFHFVFGVNGGRRFHKFQIKWLDKQRKVLVGDILTIINKLRLESNTEEVSGIDVDVKQINKSKHCVDLASTSAMVHGDDDDMGYYNLYGLIDMGDDYSDDNDYYM